MLLKISLLGLEIKEELGSLEKEMQKDLNEIRF